MKLIAEYDEQKKMALIPYSSRIERLGKGFAALEIDEKHLDRLQSLTTALEKNAMLQFEDQDHYPDSFLIRENNIIWAFIGYKKASPAITHYYNMNTKKITAASRNNCFQAHPNNYAINCFSQTNQIDTVNFIKCIRFLAHLSKKNNKPIIIYASVESPHYAPLFQQLFCKIIDQYLSAVKGLLVIKSSQADAKNENLSLKNAHRNYSGRIIEDHDAMNQSLKKAILVLNALNMKERQIQSLFNDYFYSSIAVNEEIYVPLLTNITLDSEYYQTLGFQYINFQNGLHMLYGRKGDFDKHRESISKLVNADYRLVILTHAPCMRDNGRSRVPYFLPPASQKYTGKGGYIGIITSDDIDYTHATLRNPDGSTRIALIWEQLRTTEGNTYFPPQINAALASPNPNEVIPLPSGESLSTLMAAISGGWDEVTGYRGIAPDAEFLVAKIRPASESLQRIYGGMPNPKAIIYPDAIIGMLKLIDFALEQERPLVLIMPFNGNIDSHDAALLIQQQISALTRRPGLTIIVPTGDEANKRHHFNIMGAQSGTRVINLEITAPNQNVVGVIYQWGNSMLTTRLHPPTGTDRYINLKISGVNQLGNTLIHSTGEQMSYFNGTLRILFRLENAEAGRWRIESEVNMGTVNRIEFWISQEELNEHTRLDPSSALSTMGSTSAIPNVMSVGGYDFDATTVIISSGRGDPISSNVVPLLVTYGKNITAPCNLGDLESVTGTIPAVSVMAGSVAAIYEGYMNIGLSPLPNTIVMNSIIKSELTQYETLIYPNPSQGYGIFSLFTLTQMLAKIR